MSVMKYSSSVLLLIKMIYHFPKFCGPKDFTPFVFVHASETNVYTELYNTDYVYMYTNIPHLFPIWQYSEVDLCPVNIMLDILN